MTDLLERSIAKQIAELATLRPAPGLSPAAGALSERMLEDSRHTLFGLLRALRALRERTTT